MDQKFSTQHQARRLVKATDLPGMLGYEWLTVSALRHHIFQAESRCDSRGRTVVQGNGLGSAIIRLGRRILIDVERFDEWVLSHRIGEDTNA